MALCWRAGRRSSCSSSTKSSHDSIHAASSRNVTYAVIGSGGLILACGPVEVRWTLVSRGSLGSSAASGFLVARDFLSILPLTFIHKPTV